MNIVSWRQWDRTQNQYIVIEHDLDNLSIADRANVLVRLLNMFDLTYAYSDDHSVWAHGENNKKLIDQVSNTLPKKIAVEEYNRMVSRNFSQEYLDTDEGRGWLKSY